MIVLIAIIIGLIINYTTGGFVFSSLLCAAAGLFLIMPSLLNVKIKDLKIVFKNKKILFLNLIINFIFLPLVFFGLAKLFFGENIIAYSFLLLGLLSGGGLSFAWVNKTKGDIKTAFSLFLLNISVFTILFIPLNHHLSNLGTYFFLNPQVQTETSGNIFNLDFIPYTITQTHCFMDSLLPGALTSCFSSTNGGPSPMVALIVLIVFPLIISRVILLSDKLVTFIRPYIKIVGQIASFFVIAYIFSLKEVHKIFDIEIIYLIKLFIPILIAYTITFVASFTIFKYLGQTKERASFFWLGTTRFITLGLVFSFSFASNFGLGFMIVFILSYFIQIGFAAIFSNIIKIKEEA